MYPTICPVQCPSPRGKNGNLTWEVQTKPSQRSTDPALCDAASSSMQNISFLLLTLNLCLESARASICFTASPNALPYASGLSSTGIITGLTPSAAAPGLTLTELSDSMTGLRPRKMGAGSLRGVRSDSGNVQGVVVGERIEGVEIAKVTVGFFFCHLPRSGWVATPSDRKAHV